MTDEKKGGDTRREYGNNPIAPRPITRQTGAGEERGNNPIAPPPQTQPDKK
jgi:hypothetical protein